MRVFSVLGSRFSVLGSRFLRFLNSLKYKSNRFLFASLAILCLSTCGGGGGGGGGSNGENGSDDPEPLPPITFSFPDKQIVAGANHTCVLWKEGSDDFVKCWGNGEEGRLGRDSTTGIGAASTDNIAALAGINLGTGRSALQISTGIEGGHACAVLDDYTLKCWGRNGGQLGQGHSNVLGDGAGEMAALPPIALGTGRSARRVATGSGHTCAVLDNGSVKCWGWADRYQIRSGSNEDVGDGPGEMGDNLTPVSLGAGRRSLALTLGAKYSCALLDNFSVVCWGDNGFGQLGIGTAAANSGGLSSLVPVNLGTGRSARQFTGGNEHICALLDDFSVKCWGWNNSGQLGLGDNVDRGKAASDMGDNLPAVNLGTGRTARQLAAGYWHTCALLDNGNVKCWGGGESGQLGQGNTNSIGDDAGEMAALQPIDLGTGRTAVQIAAGSFHTCALLDDDSLKCWGLNNRGQLGLGHTNNLGDGNRSDGTSEMGDNLPAVSFR